MKRFYSLKYLYHCSVVWPPTPPTSAFSSVSIPQLIIEPQAQCQWIFLIVARLCLQNWSCCFRVRDLTLEHCFNLVSPVVALRRLVQVKTGVHCESLHPLPNQGILFIIVGIYFMHCLMGLSGVVRQVEGDVVIACGGDYIDGHVEGKDGKGHPPERHHPGSVCVDWKQQGARMTLHNAHHLKSSRASQVLISEHRRLRMQSTEREGNAKSRIGNLTKELTGSD